MHEGVQFPNALLQSRCQKAGDPVDLTALLDIEYESTAARCSSAEAVHSRGGQFNRAARGGWIRARRIRKGGARCARAPTPPRRRAAAAKQLRRRSARRDRRAAKQWATIGDGLEVRLSGIAGAGNGLFWRRRTLPPARLPCMTAIDCKMVWRVRASWLCRRMSARRVSSKPQHTQLARGHSKQAGHSHSLPPPSRPLFCKQVRSTLTATLFAKLHEEDERCPDRKLAERNTWGRGGGAFANHSEVRTAHSTEQKHTPKKTLSLSLTFSPPSPPLYIFTASERGGLSQGAGECHRAKGEEGPLDRKGRGDHDELWLRSAAPYSPSTHHHPLLLPSTYHHHLSLPFYSGHDIGDVSTSFEIDSPTRERLRRVAAPSARNISGVHVAEPPKRGRAPHPPPPRPRGPHHSGGASTSSAAAAAAAGIAAAAADNASEASHSASSRRGILEAAGWKAARLWQGEGL